MQKKQKSLKPRNHVVRALVQRAGGSGAHQQSRKTDRTLAKRVIKQYLEETLG